MGIFINGGDNSLVMIDTNNDNLHIVSVISKEQMERLGYAYEKEKDVQCCSTVKLTECIDEDSLAVFHFRFNGVVSELMEVPLVYPNIVGFLLSRTNRFEIVRHSFGQFTRKREVYPLTHPLYCVSPNDLIETLRMYAGYQNLGKFAQSEWDELIREYGTATMKLKTNIHTDTDIADVSCLWTPRKYDSPHCMVGGHNSRDEIVFETYPCFSFEFYRRTVCGEVEDFNIGNVYMSEVIKRTIFETDAGSEKSKEGYFFRPDIYVTFNN